MNHPYFLRSKRLKGSASETESPAHSIADPSHSELIEQEPKWEPDSPFTINYLPSKEAQIKHNLKRSVKLDITKLANDWRSEVSKSHSADLGEAAQFAVMLLFCRKSLSIIHRILVEDTWALSSTETLGPDVLYESFEFLRNRLESLLKYTFIGYARNAPSIDQEGFSYSDKTFWDDRLSVNIYLAQELDFGCKGTEEFEKHRTQFVLILIARELMNRLAAFKSKRGVQRKKKYMVESKYCPRHKLDVGFAWERLTFSVITMVVHQLDILSWPKDGFLKKIILNVYDQSGPTVNEFFMVPSNRWFDNILRGCQAEDISPSDCIDSLYMNEDASVILRFWFQEPNPRKIFYRSTHCRPPFKYV